MIKMVHKLMIASSVAALGAVAIFGSASAQTSSRNLLDRLDRGQWELRYRDGNSKQLICLRTGRELIQLRHTGQKCSHYVFEDGADNITVQYKCAGDGYGRTNIRRETSGLVQIEGQGLKDERPFHFVGEARHIGACR